MTYAEQEANVAELRELEDRVKPMLAGHPPEMQGALLADLTALWIAGHAPALREEMFQGFVEMVSTLVPINEVLLFGPKGHPAGKEDAQEDAKS